MEERLPRKLAAILYADVVGYSRMAGEDEDATHRRLKESLELVSRAVTSYHGRVINYSGDAALAMFEAVVDALSCAAAIQRDIEILNQDVPDERKIQFRIGINLGDIIEDDGDIFGDGVNIAARLEKLSEPGGICVSESAHAAAGRNLPFDFEFMGEQQVKNIADPVRAYHARLKSEAELPGPGELRTRKPPWLPIAVTIAVVLLFLAGTFLWLNPWEAVDKPVEKTVEKSTSVEPMVLPPMDKPSVAVLPFVNISGDDEQEYFSDGMTEDLITDLSKILNMTVIARSSTSGYKGKEIDIREVGKALNVQYVLEGSVRKIGERVRINAQLIDATTGGHLWAERYDGDLNDIFSLQDQVLKKIVGSLKLELSEEERRRLAKKGTDSIAAHDLYLRGLFQESTFSREGNQEAMRLYEQALSIDPDYALPYTRIANILEMGSRNGWSNDIQGDLAKAVELTEKAIILDPQNPKIHWSLGRATARLRTPGARERGIAAMQRAIDLDPDFADAYAYLTVLYISDGRAEDGLRSVETAMRLNSGYPFWYIFMRGMARFVTEDYESAIADFEAAAERSPTVLFVRWWLAASYAQAGQLEDAEWQYEEMQMLGFDSNITTILTTQPIQDPGYLAIYTEGLRKAGIPE